MLTRIGQGLAAALLASALAFSLTAWSGGRQLSAATATPQQLVALPGYQISVFATKPTLIGLGSSTGLAFLPSAHS